jgi:hypothetical protein
MTPRCRRHAESVEGRAADPQIDLLDLIAAASAAESVHWLVAKNALGRDRLRNRGLHLSSRRTHGAYYRRRFVPLHPRPLGRHRDLRALPQGAARMITSKQFRRSGAGASRKAQAERDAPPIIKLVMAEILA